MNSLTLKDKGFSEFVPLKGLAFSSLPYNKGIVLALIDISANEKATSDILYIGKTKKPTKRVFGGYLSGNGGKATRKISSKLLTGGYLEKVSVSWMLSDNPKAEQLKLLELFNKEHGGYPEWNVLKKIAVPVKVQPKAKAAKSRPVRKQPAKPVS